jgi:hypothetical protein
MSANDVAKLLGVTLRPPKNRWITYLFDASHHRVSAPHKNSGSRYLCTITPKVPSVDELRAAPEGGFHLLVRNDTLAVLEIPGVLERIERLVASSPLMDVVIWDTSQDTPVVYSLRGMVGVRGTTTIPLELEGDLTRKAGQLWQLDQTA